MRNPGKLITLISGETVVIYNHQPLYSKGKIILHKSDNRGNVLKRPDGQPQMNILSTADYNKKIKGAKLIGFID